MRLATAANRRQPRSLAAPAAREDRILLSVRQPPKIYPALPIDDVAPTRRSRRGLTTCFVQQPFYGADS